MLVGFQNFFRDGNSFSQTFIFIFIKLI